MAENALDVLGEDRPRVAVQAHTRRVPVRLANALDILGESGPSPGQQAVAALPLIPPQTAPGIIPPDLAAAVSPTLSQANESLPGVLGALGTAVGGRFGGGPGARAGAAIGGGVGAALRAGGQRLLGQPSPADFPEFRKAVLRSALGQEAGAAAGQLGGLVLQKGGKLLMRAALAPGAALKGFPDVGEVAIDESMPQGKQFAGAIRAREAWQEAVNHEENLLEAARQAGRRFTIDDLAQESLKRVQKGAGRPLTGPEQSNVIQQVRTTVQDLLKQRTMGVVPPPGQVLEPWQVRIVKQEADDAAQAVLSGRSEGTLSAADPNVMSDLGSASRRQLATIPGWQPAAKRVQGLIGLMQAATTREAPIGSPEAVGLGGRIAGHGAAAALGATSAAGFGHTPMERVRNAAVGAGVGGVLGTPEVLSALALLSNGPAAAILPYLGQLLGGSASDKVATTP